jgi:hypothetical protein
MYLSHWPPFGKGTSGVIKAHLWENPSMSMPGLVTFLQDIDDSLHIGS